MKLNRVTGLFILLGICLVVSGYLLIQFMNAKAELNNARVYERAYIALEALAGVGRMDGSVHHHADFKVYVNGKELPLYTQKNILANNFAHMHDDANDQNVIHVEATGITIRHFFRTIGVELSRKCLMYEGTSYCSSENSTLKYYVNGALNEDAPDYYIEDKDKILVSYGPDSEVQKQIESIGNNACIQSNNC